MTGIVRKPVQAVTLTLPIPPSVNALWTPRKRGIRSSDAYKAWKDAAGWELVRQKPGCVRGPYELWLTACRAETKADLGNLEKALSDLLQAHSVIENDRLSERIDIQWGAPAGIAVLVVSASDPQRTAA
jgi:Holliday junction resolvase RusA-like endonuclease